ncbi:hypothetical protein AAVH_12923 [Aphelenchoides avenae]|nr:hypothetical protein AAVH_12923 [Aphelenchus avenae]
MSAAADKSSNRKRKRDSLLEEEFESGSDGEVEFEELSLESLKKWTNLETPAVRAEAQRNGREWIRKGERCDPWIQNPDRQCEQLKCPTWLPCRCVLRKGYRTEHVCDSLYRLYEDCTYALTRYKQRCEGPYFCQRYQAGGNAYCADISASPRQGTPPESVQGASESESSQSSAGQASPEGAQQGQIAANSPAAQLAQAPVRRQRAPPRSTQRRPGLKRPGAAKIRRGDPCDHTIANPDAKCYQQGCALPYLPCRCVLRKGSTTEHVCEAYYRLHQECKIQKKGPRAGPGGRDRCEGPYVCQQRERNGVGSFICVEPEGRISKVCTVVESFPKQKSISRSTAVAG